MKNIKIFVFSDWRIHSIEKLHELITLETPDVIIYAGDDLKRIVPIEKNYS